MLALPEVLAPYPIPSYPKNPPPLVTLRRPFPLCPSRLASWIEFEAKVRNEPISPFVLAEIKSLCAELSRLAGIGLQPQRGSHLATLTLGVRDVLVEYDYTPGEPAKLSGPPEDCYEGSDEELTFLNVYVNGQWVDADRFSEKQLEEWDGELRAQMEAARESDDEDRAAARYADREEA
ncbi:MAG: hypothetical protein IPK42_10550 [Betaproteobacteria bacterium]|nr:hypothetical protein [Betaproteobacteria bacterium]